MPLVATKLLWRGLDRQKLRKLQNALRMLEARDLAQDTKVHEALLFRGQEFVPFFFAEEANDATDQAIQLLKARIDSCLAARV